MKLHQKIKNFVAQRRAIVELEALDDRSLRDIGVSRAHIRAAIKGNI